VRYVAPTSVVEASELLASTEDARVFAGATDILPQAALGRHLPSLLVDLKRIPRLSSVEYNGSWIIGAATPVARIAENDRFRAHFLGLTEAMRLIGSDQIQSRASLGGNLCNASPAADSGPSLVANQARVVIAGLAGERTIPIEELVVGPGRTSLALGEFVVEFIVDTPPPQSGDAYLRFTPRTEMDIAVVGVAARMTVAESGECTKVSVVLGAVAPTTVSVDAASEIMLEKPLTDQVLDEMAQAAREACQPITDKRGTREYRIHLAGVLTRRAVRAATQRAVGA
jgi:CO/xanthine dehydrogenase FAD-binding subunit